jgi:hypothetical protein
MIAAGAAAVAWHQAGSAQRPLAQLFPGGALLYLEAKDFSRLLSEWNGSTVKQDWLRSANYAEFQRSNLFLKLGGFYKSYGAAAGFTPDMASLQTMAGNESALALYDLQHVQFAYITRLPEARIAQSRLGLSRRSFETRQASGITFYVNRAEDSTVAFSSTNGYLLIATDEDRMAGMLGLLAGKDTPNIANQGWYKQPTEAAGAPGELRLAMDLENLVDNTYFRSYWVQRNATEVRRFLSGVADIHRTPTEIREQRVLLKRPGLPEDLPSADAISAAASLRQLAPDDAGLYRVWAKPSVVEAAALLDERIFNPRAGGDAQQRYAPQEQQSGIAGSEWDLETRIDEPPLQKSGENSVSTASKLLDGADVRAMLQVQKSKTRSGFTFLSLPCAVVLTGRAVWDVDRVKNAMGGAWISQPHGTHTIYRVDGLAHTVFSIEGPMLIVANDEDLLSATIDRRAVADAAPSFTFAGYFRHGQERANYGRLMSALDFLSAQTTQPQPPFFSGNMASLSYALRRVNGVEVTERATADRVEQLVVYK